MEKNDLVVKKTRGLKKIVHRLRFLKKIIHVI
jgi:hypothetical protein